jgi:hypothetical protein
VTGPHTAGRTITVHGTSAPNHVIFVNGGDRHYGAHQIGSTTSDSSGNWQLRIPGGVNYNTTLQAKSGTQSSSKVHFQVHQVLRIKSDKFRGETGRGFKYRLTGSSSSHIPGEVITVLENGKIIGKGKMSSNGTFAVTFLVKHKRDTLSLHGTGRNGRGVEFTLPGNHRFRV